MAEIITKDRKEYNIWDKVNSVWNRLNFLTNAKSVDADDGKNLETKVGAINGISSSSTATDENIAASIGYVNQGLTELNTNLTANNLKFKFGYDGDSDQYGYYGADGSLIPFNSGLDYAEAAFGATPNGTNGGGAIVNFNNHTITVTDNQTGTHLKTAHDGNAYIISTVQDGYYDVFIERNTPIIHQYYAANTTLFYNKRGVAFAYNK